MLNSTKQLVLLSFLLLICQFSCSSDKADIAEETDTRGIETKKETKKETKTQQKLSHVTPKPGEKTLWTLKKDSDIPFEFKLHRVFFDGECASGPVPEKRQDASGIAVVADGELKYKGDDLLISSQVEGVLLFKYGSKFPNIEKINLKKTNAPAELLPKVRGSDPFISGTKRQFSFKSQYSDPGFCELPELEVKLLLFLKTKSLLGDESLWILDSLSLDWAQISSMTVDAQVKLIERGTSEPVAAHMVSGNKILISKFDGTGGWVDFKRIKSDQLFSRGKASKLPISGKGGSWAVKINEISSVKEYEDKKSSGEDEFYVLVDLEITNVSEKPATIGRLSMNLEVSPDKLLSPLPLDMGRMNKNETIDVNASVSGKLIFTRTRFQRPTRLVVKMDGGTVYLDVLDYSIAPERAPELK